MVTHSTMATFVIKVPSVLR